MRCAEAVSLSGLFMPMRLGLFLGLVDAEGVHLNSGYQFGLRPLKARLTPNSRSLGVFGVSRGIVG